MTPLNGGDTVPPMNLSRCDAIVLASMDFRESDKIVTLFTLQHGKIRGVAKGAKRSVKRFGVALESFARLNVELVIKEGLCGMRSADVVTVFPHIRDDLMKIALAGYAVEVVDRLLPEGLSNPRLFRLLSAYLERLDTAPLLPSDRRFFEMNLLNILGYRISLDKCSTCGTDLSKDVPRRAGAAGAVLCAGCGRFGKPISPETALLLERSLKTGRFGAVVFSPASLHEAGELLDAAIAAHLSRPLNSLVFLRQISADFPA